MASPLDSLRQALREKLQPQSMRLLCGEMSAAEMRTALALLNWVLRMCDRFEINVTPALAGPTDDDVLNRAMKCLARAQRSHPDSMSSIALQSVELELKREFAISENSSREKVSS